MLSELSYSWSTELLELFQVEVLSTKQEFWPLSLNASYSQEQITWYNDTIRKIKWTECKTWKRNSEKFNFELNLFLWFRINYSRNWHCAWNLAFPVFISPIVWNVCEKLHPESVFQWATQRARILLTDNIQSGGSCSVNSLFQAFR